MASKLEKLKMELNKAKTKRDQWDNRVKELEKKCRETENTIIHDMVHAANLTPEQLAILIRQSKNEVPKPNFNQKYRYMEDKVYEK